MSFLDKFIASITPPESEETRLRARDHARAEAIRGGWFALVIDHHDRIEQAFAEVKAATTLRRGAVPSASSPSC